MRLVKDLLENVDHEFHRRVVVVQQNALIKRRFLGPRLLFGAPLGNDFAVTIVAIAASAIALACFDDFQMKSLRHLSPPMGQFLKRSLPELVPSRIAERESF